MDIKFKDNSLLSLGSTINTAITDNCTSIYVNNCPNVSGIAILRQCSGLTRVRLDIGNVSGSFSELMQYSTLAGFNDNYEPQTKPRLVGTWTVNDWYTTAQLAQAQAVFDGLTIVGDPNYLINFNDLAVQVLDPNEDNYNPAVAIILQGQNLGTTMTDAPLGYGRWCLTKTQATAITSVGTWFSQKTTVNDTNGIVSSDTTATYNFESFDEFSFLSVTSLSNTAFYNCSLLESINLPTTIQTIGYDAFNNCTKLSCVINLPNLTSFGDNAYGCCSAFKNTKITSVINLGRITKLIGKVSRGGVFENCSELVSVILPSTLTIIQDCVFKNCSKLESVTYTSNITMIGASAFSDCSALTNFVIPNSLTYIGTDAFFNCTNISGTLYLPNLTSFGEGPYGDSCAFSATNITQVTDLGTITSLVGGNHRGVFLNCKSLVSAVLPSTLTRIGHSAFRECTSLLSLTVYADTPPTVDSRAFENMKSDCVIYVPSASVADYKSASGWSTRANYIQAIPSN